MFFYSDEAIQRYFQKRDLAVRIRRTAEGGRRLRWVETGLEEEGATLVVFIHGAPGSSGDFFWYLADRALNRRATLVSLDRPGYGDSGPEDPAPELSVQARSVNELIAQYPVKPVVLVGHSYGGPIALCAAQETPSVALSILLAPVLDPVSEPAFWFSDIGRWRWIGSSLPGAIRSATEEKLQHRRELEQCIDRWPSLQTPIVHWHGRWDLLAPAANIRFIQSHLNNDLLKQRVWSWGGHLLPWTHFRQVKKLLLAHLDPPV